MLDRNELENLITELLSENSGVSHEKTAAIIGIYINRLSEDISKAITPITTISAPFVVALLELYAENIRRDFQCGSKIIETVKAAQREKITMVLPTEETRNEDNGE